MNSKSQAYLAEMVGTFALVFFGTMSVTVFTQVMDGGSAGLLGIAFAHAVVIAVMVYCIGHLSGCHINPAVTIAMVATKRMAAQDGVTYVIAQLAGASLAGLVHLWILPDQGAATGYGATLPSDVIGGSAAKAAVIEALLTFFLVWSIFATAVSGKAPQGWHGFAIGMTLLFTIFAGGPLTGAALNPARAFGPSVAGNDWTAHWAYWVGPVAGGLVAAWFYTYAFMRPEERPTSPPSEAGAA